MTESMGLQWVVYNAPLRTPIDAEGPFVKPYSSHQENQFRHVEN